MAENATEPDLEQEQVEAELEAQDGEPEPQLDPETAARRRAALAHVRVFGDPVLRSRARPVDRFDDELVAEAQRMGALMVDSIGVGLAATQVGVLHRLLVYRVHQQAPVATLVNPVIEWSSRAEESAEEGCLSLPGVHVDVERAIHVRVAGVDEYGEPRLVEASGLEARVLQHEIDHLDGVLVFDRIGRSQRKDAMKAMREAIANDER